MGLPRVRHDWVTNTYFSCLILGWIQIRSLQEQRCGKSRWNGRTKEHLYFSDLRKLELAIGRLEIISVGIEKCDVSTRSGWMSLVLEKRESWQVAFTWSQAPCSNLLMVKKAASRKASPNRGLFELCRVKKGRGLGKKRISPEWGFQVSARDIPASQQVRELCAHPQLTWISLKPQLASSEDFLA